MESLSQYEKLMQDPENTKCADCGTFPTTHASVNNGVFLCSGCKEKHESLGPEISLLKPLSELIPADVAKLSVGGNERFFKFMSNYDLNALPARIKYKTHAAQYYRKNVG